MLKAHVPLRNWLEVPSPSEIQQQWQPCTWVEIPRDTAHVVVEGKENSGAPHLHHLDYSGAPAWPSDQVQVPSHLHNSCSAWAIRVCFA